MVRCLLRLAIFSLFSFLSDVQGARIGRKRQGADSLNETHLMHLQQLNVQDHTSTFGSSSLIHKTTEVSSLLRTFRGWPPTGINPRVHFATIGAIAGALTVLLTIAALSISYAPGKRRHAAQNLPPEEPEEDFVPKHSYSLDSSGSSKGHRKTALRIVEEASAPSLTIVAEGQSKSSRASLSTCQTLLTGAAEGMVTGESYGFLTETRADGSTRVHTPQNSIKESTIESDGEEEACKLDVPSSPACAIPSEQNFSVVTTMGGSRRNRQDIFKGASPELQRALGRKHNKTAGGRGRVEV